MSTPDTVLKDIQTLNKFDTEQYEQIIEVSLHFLVMQNKSSELLERISELASDIGVNASILKNVTRSCLWLVNRGVQKNWSAAQLRHELLNSGLADEKAAVLANKFEKHQAILSRSALCQTLVVNQLVDMEWKFGVTAGSSELGRTGNTFLQLKLVINTGEKLENTYLELTLPQFYAFLHEMDRAKSSLEILS